MVKVTIAVSNRDWASFLKRFRDGISSFSDDFKQFVKKQFSFDYNACRVVVNLSSDSGIFEVFQVFEEDSDQYVFKLFRGALGPCYKFYIPRLHSKIVGISLD